MSRRARYGSVGGARKAVAFIVPFTILWPTTFDLLVGWGVLWARLVLSFSRLGIGPGRSCVCSQRRSTKRERKLETAD